MGCHKSPAGRPEKPAEYRVYFLFFFFTLFRHLSFPLRVCLYALLLVIQPRKNNKPRDTRQILDVISLLSGSEGKKGGQMLGAYKAFKNIRI